MKRHPHLETDFCPIDLFRRLLRHMYCVQMLGKPRRRTGESLVVVEPRASLEHQTRLPEVWTHPHNEHLFALHIPWSPSTVSRHPEPFVGPSNRAGSSAQTFHLLSRAPPCSSDPSPQKAQTLLKSAWSIETSLQADPLFKTASFLNESSASLSDYLLVQEESESSETVSLA